MGSFGGLGAELPTAAGPLDRVRGPQVPVGSRGRSPFASLSPLIGDFSF